MDKKEYHRLYARAWRAKNKEHIGLYNRTRWHVKKRYQRRTKTLAGRQCMFCSVVLASEHIKVKQKKYCNGCLENPNLRRWLRKIYHKRFVQKRDGQVLTPVSF